MPNFIPMTRLYILTVNIRVSSSFSFFANSLILVIIIIIIIIIILLFWEFFILALADSLPLALANGFPLERLQVSSSLQDIF